MISLLHPNWNYTYPEMDYSSFKNTLNSSKTSEVNSSSSADSVGFDKVLSENSSFESGLDYLGPNAPEQVKKAWIEAAEEVGVDGFGRTSDGKMNHLSAMFVASVVQRNATGKVDVLGNTVSSAIKAAQEALNYLNNPLSKRSSDVDGYVNQEKQFYQSFISKLKTEYNQKAGGEQIDTLSLMQSIGISRAILGLN